MTTLTYPLDKTAFLAYQQAEIGRVLTDGEIGLLEIVAGHINQAFEAGQNGGALFPANAKDLILLFTATGDLARLKNPVFQQFFAALLIWLNEAYQAGVEEARG